jgi:uncharacterized membrane protein YhfC
MDVLVVLMYLIAAAVMIGLPLLIGRYANRKYKAPWKLFGWGALCFVLVQLVHAPLVYFTQGEMFQWIGSMVTGNMATYAVFAVFLGLLAGLFEEVGRYVVFHFKKKEWKLDMKKALMFGAGWGGIESILLGLLMLVSMFAYAGAAPITPDYFQSLNASMNGTLTAEDVVAINEEMDAFLNLTPFDLLPAPIERAGTIMLHIALTLMVAAAVIESRKILLVGAVFFHSPLDALAVFGGTFWGVWPTESMVVAFGIASVGYISKRMK